MKYDLLAILDCWFLAHQNTDLNILDSQSIFFEKSWLEEIELEVRNGFNEITPIEIATDISSFSIEEISVGISYLYTVISKKDIKKELEYDFITVVNKKSIKKNRKKYLDLIFLACKLQTIIEWEAKLDFFDYNFSKDNKEFIIMDEYNRFEKGFSIGYAKFDEQRYIFGKKIAQERNDDSFTFDKVISELDPNDFVKVIGEGQRKRYKFEFPEPILSFFSTIDFEDHMTELYHLAKEWTLTESEIKSKCIVGEATLYDISKFMFVFHFMSKMINKFITLNKKLKTDDFLGMGQVWMFDEDFFKIMDIFLERSKSEPILKILTMNLSSPYIDFQYTPIVRNKTRVGIFLSLLTGSNILRNVIKYSYGVNNKIVTNNNGIDGLSKAVANSFKESKGFKVLDSYEYRHEGIDAEIDVLAISEQCIYIIECKNSLYSTNAYEMRSSVDHLAKAKKQLDLHKKAFEDEKFIIDFNKKHNENVPRKIITLIVMGNRLFAGNENYGHPIRSYFELDNILTGGYIGLGFAKYRIWNQAYFEEQDLLDYLNYQTSYIKWQYESLEEFKSIMTIGGSKISYTGYVSNQIKLLKKIRQNYTVEILNQEQYDHFLSSLN